jgi:hypothetical protein
MKKLLVLLAFGLLLFALGCPPAPPANTSGQTPAPGVDTTGNGTTETPSDTTGETTAPTDETGTGETPADETGDGKGGDGGGTEQPPDDDGKGDKDEG